MIPKVSVIMPSFNVGQYIRECMESVINQTLKEIEIICVDAGSTDGTLEVLQEYASKDKRITLINSDKKSYGYQMNIGIEAAKGEYLGIVETDDFVDRNMFYELYKIAVDNNADFVKENFQKFVKTEKEVLFFPTQICTEKSLYEKRLINRQKEVILHTQAVVIWSGIYKRDFVVDHNIRFNETPGASFQDNGFWFISSLLATNVFFHNNSHYFLRRDNPNSSIANKEKVYCICEEYDFILQFLEKDSKRYNDYISLYWLALFHGYLFTLQRIDIIFKKDFLNVFSSKLKEGLRKEEIDLSLFSKKEAEMLNDIVNNPNRIKLRKQILRPINIKEATYFQRLVFCYEDNGLIYTITHVFNRLMEAIKKK